jgi:hypothetical protein
MLNPFHGVVNVVEIEGADAPRFFVGRMPQAIRRIAIRWNAPAGLPPYDWIVAG